MKRERQLAAVLGLCFITLIVWWLSASLRGRIVARFDVARGHYRQLGYGLPSPSRGVYVRLLHERYGIEYRAVAACLVSPELKWYADGYDDVSMAAARQKFGRDVFAECRRDAVKVLKESQKNQASVTHSESSLALKSEN